MTIGIILTLLMHSLASTYISSTTKSPFSINLMAIVDADYKFLVVDIGQMGSASDGGVLDNSNFGSAWNRDRVNMPPPVPLPGTETNTPYVLVADEAFPLKPNLMRPYPGREATNDMRKQLYHYRLSRARRVVENAFGILANRWHFLFNPVDADPEKLTVTVNAAYVLHNLLCTVSDTNYMPPGYGDTIHKREVFAGFWHTELHSLDDLSPCRARNYTQLAADNRDKITDWCSAEGVRDWQDGLITRIR